MPTEAVASEMTHSGRLVSSFASAQRLGAPACRFSEGSRGGDRQKRQGTGFQKMMPTTPMGQLSCRVPGGVQLGDHAGSAQRVLKQGRCGCHRSRRPNFMVVKDSGVPAAAPGFRMRCAHGIFLVGGSQRRAVFNAAAMAVRSRARLCIMADSWNLAPSCFYFSSFP